MKSFEFRNYFLMLIKWRKIKAHALNKGNIIAINLDCVVTKSKSLILDSDRKSPNPWSTTISWPIFGFELLSLKIWKLFTQHQSTHNVVEVQNVTKERFGNLYQSRDRTKRTLECKGKAFLLFMYSLVLNHIIWNIMISYNIRTIISSAYLIILLRMLMIIELIS